MHILTRATLVALPLAATAGWFLTPPSLLMGAVDVAAFFVLSILGLRALSEIDSASRPARDVQASERAASLRPRRLRDYVPLAWHAVPFVACVSGLALLAWRLESVSSSRLFVPVSFILAAPVFLWLYEVWMRSEISGAGSVDVDHRHADQRRRQRIRQILVVETILIVGLVGIGHALLGLDWKAPGIRVVLGTTGGALLAITGCAFALSSELNRRRYRDAGSASQASR
ncbi:MAG TPA: hypothetical protein VES67_06445 [Vicinamibacterales bacterium]|nr:hypothetical protein [Vicinamibacterales bacterium]